MSDYYPLGDMIGKFASTFDSKDRFRIPMTDCPQAIEDPQEIRRAVNSIQDSTVPGVSPNDVFSDHVSLLPVAGTSHLKNAVASRDIRGMSPITRSPSNRNHLLHGPSVSGISSASELQPYKGTTDSEYFLDNREDISEEYVPPKTATEQLIISSSINNFKIPEIPNRVGNSRPVRPKKNINWEMIEKELNLRHDASLLKTVKTACIDNEYCANYVSFLWEKLCELKREKSPDFNEYVQYFKSVFFVYPLCYNQKIVVGKILSYEDSIRFTLEAHRRKDLENCRIQIPKFIRNLYINSPGVSEKMIPSDAECPRREDYSEIENSSIDFTRKRKKVKKKRKRPKIYNGSSSGSDDGEPTYPYARAWDEIDNFTSSSLDNTKVDGYKKYHNLYTNLMNCPPYFNFPVFSSPHLLKYVLVKPTSFRKSISEPTAAKIGIKFLESLRKINQDWFAIDPNSNSFEKYIHTWKINYSDLSKDLECREYELDFVQIIILKNIYKHICSYDERLDIDSIIKNRDDLKQFVIHTSCDKESTYNVWVKERLKAWSEKIAALGIKNGVALYTYVYSTLGDIEKVKDSIGNNSDGVFTETFIPYVAKLLLKMRKETDNCPFDANEYGASFDYLQY